MNSQHSRWLSRVGTKRKSHRRGGLAVSRPRMFVETLEDRRMLAPLAITQVSDDTGASHLDGLTRDPTLVIAGTAAVGSRVEVLAGTRLLGSTTSDGVGNWSLDATGTVLAEGPHTLTARSPGERLSVNTSRAGFPSPLESDRGWGGGSDQWEIVDGQREYSSWAHGLAFTGGVWNYGGEPAGPRQATLDLGQMGTFGEVIIWQHGLTHVPADADIQYWDGSTWVTLDAHREFGEIHVSGLNSGYSDSDRYTFTPVTAQKVRYTFDNRENNIEGTPNTHGWIYEFDVFTPAVTSAPYEVVIDTTAPTADDVVDIAPDPRHTPVSTADVVFSEPIDVSTFTHDDITLTRDGSPVTLTSAVTASLVSGSTYQITGLEAFAEMPGDYVLTVNADGILDLAGNPGSGSTSDAWTQTPHLGLTVTSPIDEGQTTTLTATIYDPPAGPMVLRVDWGDGSAEESFPVPAGTTMFNVPHRYTDDKPAGTASDQYTISAVLTGDIALPPQLVSQSFYGGSGDQRGDGIALGSDELFVAGARISGGIAAGLLLRHPLGSATAWAATALASGSYIQGIAAGSDTLAATGNVIPPTYGASDEVGGTEYKSLFARFSKSGDLVGVRSENYFPYRGGESYAAVVEAHESGSEYFYVTGTAQANWGNSTAVLAKYTVDGALVWTRNLGDTGWSNHSFGTGLAVLNGDIYISGATQYPYTDPNSGRAVLWRYDSSGGKVWEQSTVGWGSALTAGDGAIYLANSLGFPSGLSDVQIQRYDEPGLLQWTRTWGGAGNDVAHGIATDGTRVFVTGETTSFGAGGKDLFLLEVNAESSEVRTANYFGGVQDDAGRDVVVQGTDVYVVGEARSFAEGGNALGESDVLLLRYSLGEPRAAITQVTVNNVAPTITSVANNGPVRTDSPVTVIASASDPAGANDPLTYEWDFNNDGSYEVSGSGNTASHTYASDGTYAVGVRVTDDDGGWATSSTTLTVDGTAPTVTVEQAAGQADPTSGSPINFTAVFSEPVTGFGWEDVLLGGTACPTTAVVTGDGTTYNVAVSGMSVSGAVIVSIAAGAARDAAGNLSEAGTSADNQVQYIQSVWRFDFDGFHQYTTDGFISLPPWQLKAGNAFGWTSLPPQYFERNWPEAPPYASNDGKLRYDGQATNNMGTPLTFEVDVEAGRSYDVMILTGDALWNHDRQQFTVTGAGAGGSTSTQQVDTWGGGGADYRWLHFTTTVGGTLGSVGKVSMTMKDLGGADPAAVILGMDVRPVDAVGTIALTRTSPPGDDALPADGVTSDTYAGSGAPANSLISVTAAAGSNPTRYLTITGDLDTALFGTQVLSDGSGNFAFSVKRPAIAEPALIVAEESSGLSRGTFTQAYTQPTSANVARYDFGVYGSPVQKNPDFLEVVPQTIYSATRGYGWTWRVAGANRKDPAMSDLRTDLNYARDATFRVNVTAATEYHVRVYHANPKYYGTVPYIADNFDVWAEGLFQYNVTSVARGDTVIREFTITPGADGTASTLEIRFWDRGGADGNFVVSGIEIWTGSGTPPMAPLMAGEWAAGAERGSVGAMGEPAGVKLDAAMLTPVVAEAAARWSAVGLTLAQSAALSEAQFVVADLGGSYLGLADIPVYRVQIDDDAAGWGWSVIGDRSSVISYQGPPITDHGSPMTDHRSPITGVDLLTVVMHEMGHLLGYGHTEDGLMSAVLGRGRSRAGSSAEAVEPLGRAEWRKGLSSFIGHPSSRVDDVFAELERRDLNAGGSSGADTSSLLESQASDLVAVAASRSGEEATQGRLPRRTRPQRYERDMDDCFAQLAAEEEAT